MVCWNFLDFATAAIAWQNRGCAAVVVRKMTAACAPLLATVTTSCLQSWRSPTPPLPRSSSN